MNKHIIPTPADIETALLEIREGRNAYANWVRSTVDFDMLPCWVHAINPDGVQQDPCGSGHTYEAAAAAAWIALNRRAGLSTNPSARTSTLRSLAKCQPVGGSSVLKWGNCVRVIANLPRNAATENSRCNSGVADGERLMVAVYLPVEFREPDDDATPEEEAAWIVARLHEPVAVMSEDGELLAFARPPKSA